MKSPAYGSVMCIAIRGIGCFHTSIWYKRGYVGGDLSLWFLFLSCLLHCHAELGKRGDVASLCVFGALCRVTVSQSTLERVASEAAAFRSLWLPLFSPCPLFIGRFFFAAKSLFFPSFLIALFSLCSELLHRGSFPVSRTTYLCSSWFRARVCKRPGMCGLHGLAEVWKHRFFRVRVPTFLFFFFFSLLGVSPLHHFSFFPFH